MPSMLPLLYLGPFNALLLIYVIRLVTTYRSLPTKVATSFDLRNNPTAWMRPLTWALISVLLWIILAVIFGGFYFVYAMGKQTAILPGIALLYMCAGAVFSAFMQILAVSTGKARFHSSHLLVAGAAGLLYGCALLGLR
ncbi:hypothetical protein [Terriglobus sp.]|uniref:hypothetical protein n=1 Tax=Terriglobus sp. TaxID=1889013 RepID=UPI003AFF7E62